ncbi:MAG: FAD-binding oxidoreductase [Sphingopyxis sp.]
MTRYDVAIIGAGIAGAGLAAEIAPHCSVVMLEGEDQPGYHSTGRSAAYWSESYGGPAIQPLSSASGHVLRAGGFLDPLGALQIGHANDRVKMDAYIARYADCGVEMHEVDPHTMLLGLRDDWVLGLHEPGSSSIDVGGVHALALSIAKRAGAELITRARMTAAVREGGDWLIETTMGQFRAGILVDAAGAWADAVAQMAGAHPLGITPYRRTVVQLRTDPVVPHGIPHVSDFDGTFYFKPEAGGKLWLSPHDETPVEPHDVAPEELDVAIAIDRFEHVVDWRVTGVERRWAGLRSFAPDRLPVYGFAADAPAFFWCAGQGGFGIQTAPAASAVAAALLLDRPPADFVADIDPAHYRADRFKG